MTYLYTLAMRYGEIREWFGRANGNLRGKNTDTKTISSAGASHMIDTFTVITGIRH